MWNCILTFIVPQIKYDPSTTTIFLYFCDRVLRFPFPLTHKYRQTLYVRWIYLCSLRRALFCNAPRFRSIKNWLGNKRQLQQIPRVLSSIPLCNGTRVCNFFEFSQKRMEKYMDQWQISNLPLVLRGDTLPKICITNWLLCLTIPLSCPQYYYSEKHHTNINVI